ncbi:DNA cytosine methyltransferase [Paenibacillus hunanensis]|uniref:DNA cytosine methyltransferase n=1 Tax=Paenibacillus hunanensis TaxID=539262 RepID=UPI002A6AFD55|nr:DNA cytosine methyltransferase [Paenibacillus hunanensis]WPP41349.1 DNA cytosine methyltransferase [Paenibacillus hunanensis]
MYKVLDLFSGCGGLSEGFLQAGFDVSVSVEIDQKACITQQQNHPETFIIQGDLTELTPELLTSQSGKSQFDLIIGGPPCQGFSMIGTRLGTSKSFGEFGEDPRNKLYKEFVKYVRHFQPKMFLMENVPGLYSMHKGSVKENIEQDFEYDDPEGNFIGYNVTTDIVRAVEFGVPQNRERVIFLGVRKDLNTSISHPTPIYGEGSYFTVKDAISDLPELGVKDGQHCMPFTSKKRSGYLQKLNSNSKKLKRANNYKNGYLYNHVSRYQNDRDRELFRILKPFQNLKHLDPDQIPIRLRKGFNDFYRKIDFDRPSPTIIAHLHKDGLAFIHPDSKQARSISVREAARLQSFPDNFIFPGPLTAMFKQIGNAVPPLLAYHLACHMKDLLKQLGYEELPYQQQLAFNI